MSNVPVPQQPQNQPSESPIMGLFLDRPAHMIDPKGFSACNNVRIELGRVRTDGIGWATGTLSASLGVPIYHMDEFDSLIFGGSFHMVYAGVDMYTVSNSGTVSYATPCYNQGTVSVSNGSPTVTGVGTRWNSDFQYGQVSNDFPTVKTNAAVGATKIYLNSNGFWTNGVLVVAGVFPNGTFLTGSGTDGGGFYITTSQALQIAVTSGEALQIGSVTGIRNIVRAGDMIAFGSSTPGAVGALTWYTVSSITSDTSLTLTTNYAGTTLSGSIYCIRQTFAPTTSSSGTTAFAPTCSSDTFISVAGWNGVQTPSTTPAFSTNGQCDAWYFTNNGFDPVYGFYVNSSGAVGGVLVPTIPFQVSALKQFRGIMVYGGLRGVLGGNHSDPYTNYNEIASSDDGFPIQLNTGIAFQGIATSGPFPISRLGILGANLMIYATGDLGGAGATNPDTYSGVVTSASLVGFPTIWSFSDVVQTRGPVSGGAVAVFSDRHQFLAIDGEYRYNGLFIQVMNDHVWRNVMKTFDYSRAAACFCMQADAYGDLLWAVPRTTDTDATVVGSGSIGGVAQTAFVEHYMEQANSYLFKPFTQRDFPFVAGTAVITPGAATGDINTPQYYVGDSNGNIWQLYKSNNQDGTSPLCTVTWAAKKIGNGRARMLVTRVYPEIEYQASPVGNVSVTLTLQNYPAGPVTITDTQSFNPSYSGEVGWTTHWRRGAVASVTLSDQAGVGWICDGYDWDYLPGGVRLSS